MSLDKLREAWEDVEAMYRVTPEEKSHMIVNEAITGPKFTNQISTPFEMTDEFIRHRHEYYQHLTNVDEKLAFLIDPSMGLTIEVLMAVWRQLDYRHNEQKIKDANYSTELGGLLFQFGDSSENAASEDYVNINGYEFRFPKISVYLNEEGEEVDYQTDSIHYLYSMPYSFKEASWDPMTADNPIEKIIASFEFPATNEIGKYLMNEVPTDLRNLWTREYTIKYYNYAKENPTQYPNPEAFVMSKRDEIAKNIKRKYANYVSSEFRKFVAPNKFDTRRLFTLRPAIYTFTEFGDLPTAAPPRHFLRFPQSLADGTRTSNLFFTTWEFHADPVYEDEDDNKPMEFTEKNTPVTSGDFGYTETIVTFTGGRKLVGMKYGYEFKGPEVFLKFHTRAIDEQNAYIKEVNGKTIANIWKVANAEDQKTEFGEEFYNRFMPLLQRFCGSRNIVDGYPSVKTLLYIHVNDTEPFRSDLGPGLQLATNDGVNCVVKCLQDSLGESQTAIYRHNRLMAINDTLPEENGQKVARAYHLNEMSKIISKTIVIIDQFGNEMTRSTATKRDGTCYEQEKVIMNFNAHAVPKNTEEPNGFNTLKLTFEDLNNPMNVTHLIGNAKIFYPSYNQLKIVEDGHVTLYRNANDFSHLLKAAISHQFIDDELNNLTVDNEFISEQLVNYNFLNYPKAFSLEASEWRKLNKFRPTPTKFIDHWTQALKVPCQYSSGDHYNVTTERQSGKTDTIDMSQAYPSAPYTLAKDYYERFGFPGECMMPFDVNCNDDVKNITGIVVFTTNTTNPIIKCILRAANHEGENTYSCITPLYACLLKFPDFQATPIQVLACNRYYTDIRKLPEFTIGYDKDNNIGNQYHLVRQYIGTLKPKEEKRVNQIYTNDKYLANHYARVLKENDTLMATKVIDKWAVLDYIPNSPANTYIHTYAFIVGYTLIAMLDEIQKYNTEDIIAFNIDALMVKNFKPPKDLEIITYEEKDITLEQDLGDEFGVMTIPSKEIFTTIKCGDQITTLPGKQKGTPGRWKISAPFTIKKQFHDNPPTKPFDSVFYNDLLVKIFSNEHPVNIIHGPGGAGKTYQIAESLKYLDIICLSTTHVLKQKASNDFDNNPSFTWQYALWPDVSKPFDPEQVKIGSNKLIYIGEIGRIAMEHLKVILPYLINNRCVIVADGDEHQMKPIGGTCPWNWLRDQIYVNIIEVRGDKRSKDEILTSLKEKIWNSIPNHEALKILKDEGVPHITCDEFLKLWHPSSYCFTETCIARNNLNIQLCHLRNTNFSTLPIRHRYNEKARAKSGTIDFFYERRVTNTLDVAFATTFASCQGLTIGFDKMFNCLPLVFIFAHKTEVSAAKNAIYMAFGRATNLEQIYIVTGDPTTIKVENPLNPFK